MGMGYTLVQKRFETILPQTRLCFFCLGIENTSHPCYFTIASFNTRATHYYLTKQGENETKKYKGK
jgi:hypothetical protein